MNRPPPRGPMFGSMMAPDDDPRPRRPGRPPGIDPAANLRPVVGDTSTHNPTNRRTVRVILWEGQYRADGETRQHILRDYGRAFRWRDVQLEGQPGNWRLTADLVEDTTIDLGADFPRTPEELERRAQIADRIANALVCIRTDPISGNARACLEDALRLMGYTEFGGDSG